MGGEVARALGGRTDMALCAAIEAAGNPTVGTSTDGVAVVDDLAGALPGCDVVVDFSLPGPATLHAQLCAAVRRPLVTGVTGFSDAQLHVLDACAASIALVRAPNFSIGVSVLAGLAAEAARLLGPGYDVEVIETHHRLKKDAPSGTARYLVEVLMQAMRRTDAVHEREGAGGRIGVHSLRAGTVVGDHTVVFGGPGERLELVHRADSRQAFATGVTRAIRFVQSAPPGLYGMADVLGSC